ncbi:hypothetical protein [Metabacillus litoralis]|uniref:hypothetical protein n=1 Tax=Metabacillus litoralis TaxID=152268 RepID=UPI001CFC8519|nr:hypothetical protein [Metabacillus litoralis]
MNRNQRYIPLIVTVGQVVIFPYYIIWLKEVSLTFTLFAWFFAAFSFSAAWGYRVFQTNKQKDKTPIFIIYAVMGIVYCLIGLSNDVEDYLPYIALVFQVIIGFLQGYFRAWHINQKTYHVDAVHHYLLVGLSMFGLSFIHIISPVFFLIFFGSVLCLLSFWELCVKLMNFKQDNRK